MIKRFIGIIISLITCTMLVAQADAVAATAGYSKVYKGKEASFRKAVTKHVAKWHGPDQWPTFAARVMNGPRAGQYFMGSSGHYWKDYADRKASKAHNDEWRKVIQMYVEDQSGMMFFEKQLDASYNDRSTPMWQGTIYYTKPGKRGKMLEILREGSKANRRLRHKGSSGVYNVISGGEQDGMLVIVNRMDSMADLAPQTPSIRDRWVQVYGEEVFEQAVKDWYDSFTKSRSEILQFIPEMSTPQN